MRYLRPVVVDCNDISPNLKLLDGIISSPASPTATPFVTQDIPHLWHRPAINISYSRRQEAPRRVVALLGRHRGSEEGVWDSGIDN